MSKWAGMAILGWSAFMLCSAHAAAFDCGSRPIKLAFYDFGLFYDQQGKGIDVDIIDELKRRTQCPFGVQRMPRARIWADLANGQLDMSVSGIQTPQRDQFAWFVPYLALKNFAVIDVAIASKVHSSAQFLQQKEAQFGAVRSFKHGDSQDVFLDQLRTLGRVQDSPDVEALYGKLKEGRVHGIFSQAPILHPMLRKLKMENQVVIQDWAPQQKGIPHGLVLAKSRFSEAQAQAWQAQVAAMRADGTLHKIYRRYLTEAEVSQLLDY